MSGEPPPVSGSPYIIICSGKIHFAASKNVTEAIQALSNCAAQLTSHITLANKDEIQPSDTREISDLQHSLMVNMEIMGKDEVEVSAKEMFRLLYALEEKFSGGHAS